MMPQLRRRLTRAILGGFLIGSSLIGYAQDDSTPGVVRITDARPKGVAAQTVGFHKHSLPGQYHDIGPGYYGDGCPNCYGGGCPHCQGGHCHGGFCHAKHAHLKSLFCEHYGKYSADHGFSVPGKTPIYRRGVQYNAYYPGGWYGTPQGGIPGGQIYPVVYQPTDTTQMGYYYQHVPFWMPNPNALPPRPVPAQWHNLVPVAHAPWHGNWGGGCPHCGPHGCLFGKHRHGGWGHGGSCPSGDCWVENSAVSSDATYSQPMSQPTLDTTYPPSTIEPAPMPAPAPAITPAAPPPAPPVPTNESAQNSTIRRAVLQR